MQVISFIVQWVAVDVVDDLPRLGVGDFAVFPLPAICFSSIAQALRHEVGGVGAIRLFNRRQVRTDRFQSRRGRRDHLVPAPLVLAGREAVNLSLVGVKRIAVPVPHLVVPDAKLAGCHWPVAMQAAPADFPAAPSVFRTAVPLDSLVVHQAKPVRSVFPTATINGTKGHECFPKSCTHSIPKYKALGNSWATPCVAWIGAQIQATHTATQGASA